MFLLRSRLQERQIGAEVLRYAAHIGKQGQGISACAQFNLHRGNAGHLRVGHEGHRPGCLTHLSKFAVPCDADDCVGYAKVIFTPLQPNVAAERIGALQVSFYERFIHDHDS